MKTGGLLVRKSKLQGITEAANLGRRSTIFSIINAVASEPMKQKQFTINYA